jgi:hypothetical protein
MRAPRIQFSPALCLFILSNAKYTVRILKRASNLDYSKLNYCISQHESMSRRKINPLRLGRDSFPPPQFSSFGLKRKHSVVQFDAR